MKHVRGLATSSEEWPEIVECSKIVHVFFEFKSTAYLFNIRFE